MFEQTSRLAEKLAASVSRRGFLGSLGGWAAAAAMGVAAVLTGVGTARAGEDFTCCTYQDDAFDGCTCCVRGSTCPNLSINGWSLVSSKSAPNCRHCPSDCPIPNKCSLCQC
jgi:hypothetical protein